MCITLIINLTPYTIHFTCPKSNMVHIIICSTSLKEVPYSGWIWYTLTSVMSLPLLYHETLGNGCAQMKSSSLLSHFFSINCSLWHKNNPPKRFQITHLHASDCHNLNYCHYCNVDLCYYKMSRATLILYYHASCYTKYLVNITNIFVATCIILERFGCVPEASSKNYVDWVLMPTYTWSSIWF